MENSTGDAWCLPVLLIAAVFMYIFVLSMISKISGWSDLAKKYATDKSPDDSWWTVERLVLNNMESKRIVKIAYDDDGIFLDAFFLFKLAHPRLFIPRSEIKFNRTYKPILGREYHEFSFPACPTIPTITMALRTDEGEYLKNYLARSPKGAK
ncbi:MAG: hypothetical protein HZC40_22905 [Chloroflexi bacterium]|nr:hypothetical protein [Chloroflexota bacterium]